MAQRTLLQSIQSRCRLLGLSVPTVVTTSTNLTILQLWELANEEVKDHSNREYEFPKLRDTATFTYGPSVAPFNALDLESTGAVRGYRSMVPNSFWNTSRRLPVFGPVSDSDWQQMIVMQISASVDNYRVNGNFIQLYSTLGVANNYAFQYLSNFGVVDNIGVSKELFTADTDLPRLPSRIFELGLLWRWRQIKGQPYAEEMEQYEQMLREEARNEPTSNTLRMDYGPHANNVGPNLAVAIGSWPLP